MNTFELAGKHITARVGADLRLTVLDRRGRLYARSSTTQLPAVVTAKGSQALAEARQVDLTPFVEGPFRGNRIRLGGFDVSDATFQLDIGIDPEADVLMIGLQQLAGSEPLEQVSHLYRFAKPVSDGGHLVLPHGSGYLLPADCPDELQVAEASNEWIGGRWTMPLFGMVRQGGPAFCAIVPTWWDCRVSVEHTPGQDSVLEFNWAASKGKLAYPRRIDLHFADGMDHLAMAGIYRAAASRGGLLRTLLEKADQTPVIHRYIQNILFRWHTWNRQDGTAVLDDVRRLKQMGFGINFFYPKWADGNVLKGYLLDTIPEPGSWQTLAKLTDTIRELDCPIQFFINPWVDCYPLDAPGMIKRALDHIEAKGVRGDVLYYDGYAAHNSLADLSPKDDPATRRQSYEVQNACFAETRRHGMMAGAELARFWCLADCGYFFFTDWARDRLMATDAGGSGRLMGVPVPLFQLVFHDCFIAGFSGGGYALPKHYAAGHDWPADRTPRLYELMYAAAPAYDWLPEGYVPIRDWDSQMARNRWTWLKRWSAYYRTIATSQMVSHRFDSADRSRQSIAFANGVTAQFDMARNQMCIDGVSGFTGKWQTPEQLPAYP